MVSMILITRVFFSPRDILKNKVSKHLKKASNNMLAYWSVLEIKLKLKRSFVDDFLLLHFPVQRKL